MKIARSILLLIYALAAAQTLAQQAVWTPCLISQPSDAAMRTKNEEVCARELAEARQRSSDKMLESRLLSHYAEFLLARNDVEKAEILAREGLAILETLAATEVVLGWRIRQILYLMSRQEKYLEALPLLTRLKGISRSVPEAVQVEYKRTFKTFAVRFLEMQMDTEAAELIDDRKELLELRKLMSPSHHHVEPLVPIALSARYKLVSHPDLSAYEIEKLIATTHEEIANLMVKKNFSQLSDVARELEQLGIPVKEVPSVGLHKLLARAADLQGFAEATTYHNAYAKAIVLSVFAVGDGTSPATAYRYLTTDDINNWRSMRPTFSIERSEKKQIGDRTFDILTVKSPQGVSQIVYFDATEYYASLTRIYEHRMSGEAKGGIKNATGVVVTLAAGPAPNWGPGAGDLATANEAPGKESLHLRSGVGEGLKVSAYVLYSATVNATQAPECYMEVSSLMSSVTSSKVAKDLFQLREGSNTSVLPLDAFLPGKCGLQPTSLAFHVEMSGVSTKPENSSIQATAFVIEADVPPRPPSFVTCAVCSVTRKQDPFLKCDVSPQRHLPISKSQKPISFQFIASPTPIDACKPFDVADVEATKGH